MQTTSLSRALIVASLAVAAVSLSGCSLISNAITGAVTGEDDVFSLEVGSCMNDSESDATMTTVPIVDCSEPHESEIYAALNVEGDEFPGSDALSTQADEFCLGEFEDFVGIPYDESVVGYGIINPTEGSWDGGDREILCSASKYDLDTQEIIKVTGTLKDSKQ